MEVDGDEGVVYDEVFLMLVVVMGRVCKCLLVVWVMVLLMVGVMG